MASQLSSASQNHLRRVIVTWCGIILLTLLSMSGAGAQTKPYQDFILGYQFTPPPGWQLYESTKQVGQVSLFQSASKALITVNVEDRPKQRDDGKPATRGQLDQIGRTYVQSFSRGELGKLYRNFKVVGSAPGRMGKFNTAQLEFTASPIKAGTQPVRIFVSVGGDEGKLSTVTLISPEKYYRNLVPSLGYVLRSFQLIA